MTRSAPGAVAELDPRQAAARLAELEVVDVRGPHEFAGPLGHVPGARSLPLPELDDRAAELPSDRPLLLVCRSGVRSRRACERLLARGFGAVLNLAGGMIAWNEAGLAIQEIRPGSRTALLDSAVAWVAQVAARERASVRQALGLPPSDDGSASASSASSAPLAASVPDREAVERLLDRIESMLGEGEAPADLALSLAAFRRWNREL